MDGFKAPKEIPKPIETEAFDKTESPIAPGNQTEQPQFSPPVKSIPPHHRLKWIFFKPEHVSRKKWLLIDIVILFGILTAAIGGYALYKYLTKVPPLPPQPAAVKRVIKPVTEASHLTGLQIDPALNKRPVTGVMIENSPDARPQSGLIDAGVVIEAIAEGGVTRFLALYQEAQPKYIGPIRSVRPYFLDFALAFNASVAHVGGSPEALGQIRGLGIRDLDQFYNAAAYRRISQRYAPHNVYTSMAQLDKLNKSKGYKSSTFTSLERKKDMPSKIPPAKVIDMTISGYFYNTHYKYVAATNTYKRSEGGKPHTDEKSKKQISPKVLIALVMNYSIQSDGKHSQYLTVGSGKAYIFQDGTVTKATWHKGSRSSQLTLTNAAGKTVKLNAGQTWITLVSNLNAVTYKP